MNQTAAASNVMYHGEGWAEAMGEACALAMDSIHVSALSILPPTSNASGDWPELWRAWCAASRRGVAVDIWLPSPNEKAPATLGNGTAGRAIVDSGMNVHFVQGTRLLHAKTCVIDAATVWIGSGNFTAAAAHHNYEAYLEAHSQVIAQCLIERWQGLA